MSFVVDCDVRRISVRQLVIEIRVHDYHHDQLGVMITVLISSNYDLALLI